MVVRLRAWASLLIAVASAPMHDTTTLTTRARQQPDLHNIDHSSQHNPGDPPAFRTGYTVVSLFCMSMLAGMVGMKYISFLPMIRIDSLGYRVRHTDRKAFKAFSPTHYLLFILYFISMAFILSAAIIVCGGKPCLSQLLANS